MKVNTCNYIHTGIFRYKLGERAYNHHNRIEMAFQFEEIFALLTLFIQELIAGQNVHTSIIKTNTKQTPFLKNIALTHWKFGLPEEMTSQQHDQIPNRALKIRG